MAFAEKSNDGQTNSTTAVDVIAAPASGETRIGRNVIVNNRDNIAHNVIVQFVSSGGTRRIAKQVVEVDASLVVDLPVVMDATTKKVQVVLGEAATTQLDFVTAYASRT